MTCIQDISGDNIFKPKSFPNDPDGVNKLLDTILCFANSLDITNILIGIEATSVYGTHLLYTIADSSILNNFTVQLYCFEPKIIKSFRASLGNLPKNDKMDSIVITSRLRLGNLPNEFYINFNQLGLKRLTRFRQHIVKSITREKTYLVSNLFLKFSKLTQQKVLSDNFGATAEMLLTDIFLLMKLLLCLLMTLFLQLLKLVKSIFLIFLKLLTLLSNLLPIHLNYKMN